MTREHLHTKEFLVLCWSGQSFRFAQVSAFINATSHASRMQAGYFTGCRLEAIRTQFVRYRFCIIVAWPQVGPSLVLSLSILRLSILRASITFPQFEYPPHDPPERSEEASLRFNCLFCSICTFEGAIVESLLYDRAVSAIFILF